MSKIFECMFSQDSLRARRWFKMKAAFTLDSVEATGQCSMTQPWIREEESDWSLHAIKRAIKQGLPCSVLIFGLVTNAKIRENIGSQEMKHLGGVASVLKPDELLLHFCVALVSGFSDPPPPYNVSNICKSCKYAFIFTEGCWAPQKPRQKPQTTLKSSKHNNGGPGGWGGHAKSVCLWVK